MIGGCCVAKHTLWQKTKNDEIVPIPNRATSYGAYIQFQGNDILSPKWIFGEEKEPDTNIEDIPCVLGAAYAASVRYWTYLRGLEGLIYYGFDETYISLKVWLEGGRCQLIKNIKAGHIYRTRTPYRICSEELIYNRLWIAELLLPEKLKKMVFSICEQQATSLYQKMVKLLNDKVDEITKLKEYYKNIFTIDFPRIKRFNNNSLN